MKTLIGLIPDREHVAQATEALRAAGIDPGGISTLVRPTQVWQRLEGRTKARIVFRYVALGALLGLAVGALYGVPAGIFNCSEMGCPVTLSGALLAVITVYWVLGGAFIGALIGMDRLEQDLYSYVEGVRRGAAVLVVQAPDERAADVTRLLQQAEGRLVHDIEQRA